MAVNLLPKELRPKKYIVKISKVLTNVSLIALLVFIISAVTVTSVYFVISGRLKSSQEKHEELITQIKALEETEQKIVLIKDRLEKVSEMKSRVSATERVDILEDVLNISDGIATVEESTLTEDKTNILMAANSSLNLTKLLSGLLISGGFKKIEMISFDFSRDRGYVMEFGFER
jgi:hypothetical protein